MSKILAIVNQKGGVGKTTTAINLAAFLAELGKFVLIIDLDPQGNATSGLGFDKSKISTGTYEVLTQNARISDLVHNTAHEGLRLLPTNPSLAGANVELIEVEGREFVLTNVLAEVRHAYDFIIIDCPPALGLLTINGLVASDEILIPVQAEYYALEGLGQLLETIGLIREHIKPDISILGAVLTMYDRRTKLSGEVMSELYKYFPDKIFRSVIPRTVKLAEAPSFGQSIIHYEPRGKGSRAYERLARELLEFYEEQNSGTQNF